MTTPGFPKLLAHICQRKLEQMVESSPVDGALVASSDGFEIACAGRLSSPGRIAAMTSSVYAVARALMDEVANKPPGADNADSASVVIENSGLRIVSRCIGGSDLVLLVIASTSVPLGTLYFSCRCGADELAAAVLPSVE